MSRVVRLLVAFGALTSLLTSCSAFSSSGRSSTEGAAVDPHAVVATALERLIPDTNGRFVAAALVVQVSDGREVAWGASDGSDRSLADTQRPSGSTLKLIVDVAVARAGVLANDGVIVGHGCAFPDGVSAPTDDVLPIMSIAQATATSSNCAFGKLARAVGPDRLRSTVQDLGVERPLDVTTRFGFGANTISMSELATVGVSLMRSLDAEDPARMAAAEAVIGMTADVLVTGTAAGKALLGRWAVAKTGTAGQSTDAWIIGATPEFVTVVWMGNPTVPKDGMINGAVPGYDVVHGGDLPALVWNDIMTALHEGLPPRSQPSSPPQRDVVIVVDPTVDCPANPELVQAGPPGPDVPHILTGGPIRC